MTQPVWPGLALLAEGSQFASSSGRGTLELRASPVLVWQLCIEYLC